MRQINIYDTGDGWGAEAVRDDGSFVALPVTEELQAIIEQLAGVVDEHKTETEQLATRALRVSGEARNGRRDVSCC